MSGDVDMLSDSDDTPGSSAHNRHVVTNGNGRGHINGDVDSSLSEDDDMPLVSIGSYFYILPLWENTTLMPSAKSQTTRSKSDAVTPDIRKLKRKKPVHYESSSDDDAPLASPTKSVAVPMPGATKATTLPSSSVNGHGKAKRTVSKAEVSDDGDDYGDESPVKKKPAANGRAKGKGRPKKRAKKEESDVELESEDDKPLVQLSSSPVTGKRKPKVEESSDDDQPVKKATKRAPSKKKVKKEEDGVDSETPKTKRRSTKPKKEEVNGSPKKGKGKKKAEEEEAEEIFKWWEAQDPEGDGTIKWQTLEHHGVIFPPPYEPLPKDVKMKYNGKSSILLFTRISDPFPQGNQSTYHLHRRRWLDFMQP
jgi:DNA topoisomerase I